MNKQAFLGLLRERLTEFEVSEENTNKYIRQFERYFNTMTDDEVNDQIENYEGVEGIAQNILKLIKKKQDTAQRLSPSAIKEGDPTITYPVTQLKKENSAQDGDTREIDTIKSDNLSDNVQAAVDNINLNNYEDSDLYGTLTGEHDLLEHADTDMLNVEDESETEKASDDSIELNEDNKNGDNDSHGLKPAVMSENDLPEDKERQQCSINKEEQRHPAAQERGVTPQHMPASERIERIKQQGQALPPQLRQTAQEHATTQRQTAGHRNISKHTDDKIPVRRKTGFSPDINFSELDESYIEDTAIPNTTLYWVIILLTIPLSVPLLLTVLFLFIAAFAFLAVSIVALFAALVFVVVAGTGFSLVGIIYGVTQIYTSLPVGLFEIGFGVVIGGSAMLSGILIYNTAIHFLPFVIKYLIVFFMFTMYKIKEFFKFVKKECAKQ